MARRSRSGRKEKFTVTNLPPGVTPSMIPGNRPEDKEAWEQFYRDVDKDCIEYGLSDADAFVAWKLGLSAYLEAREWGAKFLHDPND